MLLHYLKVAVRNLLKYKTQSVISIVGLAIGLAAFVYGWHWMKYETSYDSFYPDAERSYLVYSPSENNYLGVSSPVLSEYIREHCPQVEYVTRSFQSSSMNYQADNVLMNAPEFIPVDSAFQGIFPQTILYGRKLMDTYDIILSESFARKYFGEPQKALETVLVQTARPGFYLPEPQHLKVVGIMADAPQNANMVYPGYYLDMSSAPSNLYEPNRWNAEMAFTHVKLKEGYSQEEFTDHLNTSLHQLDFLKEKTFKAVPLYQKHFEFASEESFSYSAISMFTMATLLLLCCVLFNFMNLFLNRYYQRAREVKLRKSVGANNLKLVCQVMIEIFSHGIWGFLLCGCLIETTVPFFEETFSITIQMDVLWKEYVQVIITTAIVMLLLLLFPALQFIRSAGRQLMGNRPQTHNRTLVRRIGLSVQLIICLFFFASASSLYRQLRFMNHTDMGMETDNIIELMISGFEQNGKDLLEDVKRLPMVEKHTTASDYLISKKGLYLQDNVEWDGKTEAQKEVKIAQLELQENGWDMFRFRLIEGRGFEESDWQPSGNQPKDPITGKPVLNRIVVNESAVTAMQMEQPVGKRIRISTGIFGPNGLENHYTDYEIIGVIKDFHTQGMKAETQPAIVMQNFRFVRPINYFQVTQGTEQAALKAINELAEKHGWEYNKNNTPPQILTDKIKELNKSETATFRLFSILTFLCVLISLFGIFAISASTVGQRRKEIAVRKVMGATAKNVVDMFFREYIWLVGIAAIVAFPFFYYTISRWLEQFAYHIHISIGIYLALACITVVLVLLTVCNQVIQAANENPADVVKSE